LLDAVQTQWATVTLGTFVCCMLKCGVLRVACKVVHVTFEVRQSGAEYALCAARAIGRIVGVHKCRRVPAQ